MDALGNPVEQGYDALDRLTTVTTHPAPGVADVVSYILDENGNRIDVQDPNGAHWGTQFDALNRPWKSTNPDASFRTTHYDPFGNVASTQDEGGQTHVLAYDALNRPTSETITGGGQGGDQTLLYAHDGAERRTRESVELVSADVCVGAASCLLLSVGSASRKKKLRRRKRSDLGQNEI